MITPDWQNIPNASDHLKWYENKGKLKLNFFLSIVAIGMLLNGYDGSLISGLQASDAWQADVGYPNGVKLGLLNACGSFSGVVVGPIITYIDEVWGRRWGIRFYGYTILIGSVIGCIAGVSGANGYALFCVGRVIIGFGLTSFLMTSLIVVQEISHPRSRSTVAHSWNSWYILGLFIEGWVIFGCVGYISSNTSWSWRIPYIIQVGFAIYILVAVQFVPETPRWLFANGREDEAFDFMVVYHGNGNREDPLVLFEFEEMKVAILKEREAKAEKWKTILRDRSNLHRLGLACLMPCLFNMSGASILYNYYTIVFENVGITNPTTQTGIAAGLNGFTWFCQIGAVYAGKFIGRRKIVLWTWPFLLFCLVGLCAAGGVYANTGETNTSAGIATVSLVWIFQGFFNFACPVIYSYASEIQTYSMRSKGMLVWNTVYQLQGAYVSWVDAIALEAIGYKYYAVYMPLVIIQFVLVYFFMVETKGYTLEEIALAFDGGSKISLANTDILPSVEHNQRVPNSEEDERLSREGDHKNIATN
ncbi:uncharacterized protein I206_102256 [Kwoniella pini CBS 10737]|uniref:Sugar transporter n=1 Tax=Kwoniella pini CBS 10737 TaxID=1296096 RepID=A0A1B9HSZ6_9TREE|nr:sugar transporter [Kwoniella pini CBS 10737]OCF46392.1 sugar transporter [Kwoniella pini CBS 10737]